MTIISPNSISGITSITAQSGTLEFYTAAGSTLNVTGDITGNVTGNLTGNVNASGVSTFSSGIVVAAGSVSAPSISPSGDSNTGIFFPDGDTVSIGEGGTEVIRVHSSGNVGVGTNNPSYRLSTYGTGAVRHEVVCTDNNSAGAGIYLRTLNAGATVSSATIRTNNSGTFSIFNGTTSEIESLKIDSSGRITLPYQPSFFATHSSETGHLRPNANNPFIFPLAPTNVGGHYNTSNGRFTAPISGRYWFQFSGGLMELDSQRGFDIRVNGSVFNGGEAWHPDGYQTIVGKSVLLTLNINDHVTVTARSNVQLHQRYGNFCGFLIG